MRILYVDLQYDYGDPARGPNVIGDAGFREPLVQLGHEVIAFYYDDDLTGSPALQERLLVRAREVKPDLIVFCLFRDQFKLETLQALQSIAPTLNWFGDDTWRFDSFSKVFAAGFTYIVTTDKFSEPKYRELGHRRVIVSQWAAIDRHSKPTFSGEYEFDVSFVGQHHPYRAWVIDQMRASGIKVEAFGRGWENGPVSNERMNAIFRHSKINLNIGNSNSLEVPYLFSHPKALALALKSRKDRSQIKARNFEIPFFGGFQLTDYVPGIEDSFRIGEEITCYRTADEAAMQAKYYLADDRHREEIRAAGEKRAATEGYTDRWRKILQSLEPTRGATAKPSRDAIP